MQVNDSICHVLEMGRSEMDLHGNTKYQKNLKKGLMNKSKETGWPTVSVT